MTNFMPATSSYGPLKILVEKVMAEIILVGI
jgi:hypothetical protein